MHKLASFRKSGPGASRSAARESKLEKNGQPVTAEQGIHSRRPRLPHFNLRLSRRPRDLRPTQFGFVFAKPPSSKQSCAAQFFQTSLDPRSSIITLHLHPNIERGKNPRLCTNLHNSAQRGAQLDPLKNWRFASPSHPTPTREPKSAKNRPTLSPPPRYINAR